MRIDVVAGNVIVFALFFSTLSFWRYFRCHLWFVIESALSLLCYCSLCSNTV